MKLSGLILLIILVIIVGIVIRTFFYMLPIILVVWLISYVIRSFKQRNNSSNNKYDSGFEQTKQTFNDDLYEKPKSNQEIIDVEYKEKDVE